MTDSVTLRHTFVGNLEFWDSFEADARASFDGTPWNDFRQTLCHRPNNNPQPAHLSNEQVHCGEEKGVLSASLNNVGRTVSAVCRATNTDVVFADFKALRQTFDGSIPDVALMNGRGAALAAGEVKTPWIRQHNLRHAIYTENDIRLRRIIGT